MANVRIEFDLGEAPAAFRGYTQPSARLIVALRDAIEDEDSEALQWLNGNVLDITLAEDQ